MSGIGLPELIVIIIIVILIFSPFFMLLFYSIVGIVAYPIWLIFVKKGVK